MNWILEIVTQLSYSSTLSSVCYQIARLNGLLVAMGEGPGNCIVWGWLTEGGGVWLSLTGFVLQLWASLLALAAGYYGS